MANFITVEDFATDESFQDFVLDKSVSHVEKWQNYLIENPDKHDLLTEASNLVKTFSPGDVISIKKELQVDSIVTKGNKGRVIAGFLVLLSIAISVFVYKLFDNDAHEIKATYIASDEVAQFDLPDGTVAVLRPHSQLQILGDWQDTRLCRLTGDVFLDVSPGKKKFIVQTDEDKVTVLGTKFAIFSKENYKVVLEEGKIQHSSEYSDPVVLTKNQLLQRSGKEVVISKTDAKRYSFWKNEKLAFKDEKLHNIVDILQKSYGLSIQLQNEELSQKVISAQILNNNPKLLLKAIAEIYDINLVNKNESYILK